MKILSLFDGMACGHIAFQLAGIPIGRYVAYEIDKYAIKTAMHNFPDIEECGDVFNADFAQYEGFDFLVGGSPCTYWSIAQTKNRETEASGMGWELFCQYVRALREAKPRYFIYENNKSMSKEIRASIDKVFGFEAVCINSALVSAQNRQRLYWVGKRNADGTYSKVNVEQPDDRGILLRDVLETGECWRNKAVAIDANSPEKQSGQRCMCAEPINITADGKSQTIKAQYQQTSPANICCYTSTYGASGVAEPVCLRYERTEEAKRCRKAYEAHEVQHGYRELCELHPRTDGKTNTVSTVQKDNPICEPVCVAQRGRNPDCPTRRIAGDYLEQRFEAREDYKTNTLTTVQKDNMCACPIRVGTYPNNAKNPTQDSKQYRIYDIDAKSTTLCGQGGGMGAKTGLYALPVNYQYCAKYVYATPCEWDDNGTPIKAISVADGKTYDVYQVKGGNITIKSKSYPIKLIDGYYIIRKLTVRECMRLQTVPEWYDFSCVSATQA